ncbi:MAG: hypothetical protein HQL48_04840 [Gammaproteobacteria bacterium]|nr:hypothetical protein [Gammaproteobacteria bacterium]
MRPWLPLALLATALTGCSSYDPDKNSSTAATTDPADTTLSDSGAHGPKIAANQKGRANFSGHSADEGTLIDLTLPTLTPGAGKKLLAIYLVGSDLETNAEAGSNDLNELIQGYQQLSSSEQQSLDIIVAFGGTAKEGWKGMRFATIDQIVRDGENGRYGDLGDYLYSAPGAHMGDDSSLKLFGDYLKAGYGEHSLKFLDLWDHGAAYGSFGNDENFAGDGLTMVEIDAALSATDLNYEIIGFDACLNGNFELASIIQKHASYLIGSEELEPGHGWNYDALIRSFAQSSDPVTFGKAMIDNFVDHDAHPHKSDGKTLSMVDLSHYQTLQQSVDALGSYLNDHIGDTTVKKAIITAANSAQQYGKQSREDQAISLDLSGFSRTLAAELDGSEGATLANTTLTALESYVVYAKNDGTRPNSDGVSIVPPQGYDAYQEAFSSDSIAVPSRGWQGLTRAMQGVISSDNDKPSTSGEEDGYQYSETDFTSSDEQTAVDSFYANLLNEVNGLIAAAWSQLPLEEQEALAEAYWYQQEDQFWNRARGRSKSACSNFSNPLACGGYQPSYSSYAADLLFGAAKGGESSGVTKLRSTPGSDQLMLGIFNHYTGRKSTQRTLQAPQPALTSADPTTMAVTTTAAPEAVSTSAEAVKGSRATFADPNLQHVRTVYGNIVTDEGEQYLASTALLPAFPTVNANEYFTPSWNQSWYIMTYGSGEEESLWLPLEFESEYRYHGSWYTLYSSEIDYVAKGKDYSSYPTEEPFDYAKLYLTVDINGNVTSSGIRPYKIVYTSDEDEVGTILYDKAYQTLAPGDQIATLARYYSFESGNSDWFYESDLITIAQTPDYTLEPLEFEDEFGEPLAYYYMMIATDMSGNWVATNPVQAGSGYAQ